jgi:GAF domain-containing protein
MVDDRDARIAQLEAELAASRGREAALMDRLTETQAQQAATAEVLRTMASPEYSLHAVLAALEQRASQILGTAGAVFFQVDGHVMRRLVAVDDPEGEVAAGAWIERPIDRSTLAGRTVLDRRPHHLRDVMDPEEAEELAPRALERIRLYQGRTMLTVPLMRGSDAIGALLVYRVEVRPFTGREIALLETFADQAVIAIENARLFSELEQRTAQFARSVDELRALGEVSEAVSSSLDIREVLATILSHAVLLSGADAGNVSELDGATDEFVSRATYGLPDEVLASIQRTRPRLDSDTRAGLAARTGAPVQVPDLASAASAAFGPEAPSVGLYNAGLRSMIFVPLVREQRVVGMLHRHRERPSLRGVAGAHDCPHAVAGAADVTRRSAPSDRFIAHGSQSSAR